VYSTEKSKYAKGDEIIKAEEFANFFFFG